MGFHKMLLCVAISLLALTMPVYATADFVYQLDVNNSSGGQTFTADIGSVDVHLLSSTVAQITLTANAGYFFIQKDAATVDPSAAATASNFSSTPSEKINDYGSGNVSAFGSFTHEIGEKSASDHLTSVTFDLTINSGTWSSDSTVLAANNKDFSVASHFYDNAGNAGNGKTFYAANGESGRETSVPEPATLLLLGSGLIGLVVYRKISNKA